MMIPSKRSLLTLASAVLVAFNMASPTMAKGDSQELAFWAGQAPQPEKIQKVLSAGNPADILLLCVAPQKLDGLAGFNLNNQRGLFFSQKIRELPVLSRIAGKNSTLGPEKIIALHPSLIVDIGNFTPNYIDQAKKTEQLTHVPYVLFNGSLELTPKMLRAVGKALGTSDITEPQAQWAQKALDEGREHAKNEHRTVYLARSADGLQSGQPGSIHTQALEWVGLKNVVQGNFKGLASVSPEQILLWNPDLIFTDNAGFYQTLFQDKNWAGLKAVKNKTVYLIPAIPFNWLDSPPGINRLMGIRWLTGLLENKPAKDLVPEVQSFYKTFYHIDLSESDALKLLNSDK